MIAIDRLPALGLALTAPLVAIALITANLLTTLSLENARIHDGEAVAEFAARATVVLDDLQAERANAAYLLINGEEESRHAYEDRWPALDQSIATLLQLGEAERTSAVFAGDRGERMRDTFADLDRIRSDVVGGEIGVAPATDRYAVMIDAYIDTFGRQLSRYTGQTNFIASFTALARLHDRAAMETGAGLFGYAFGEVGRDRAELIISSSAEQRAHTELFRSSAGPVWTAELDSLIARLDRPELTEARHHLIEAGFSGAAPDPTHRNWWRETRIPLHYDLSVLRNRYAQDGVRAALSDARAQRDAVIRMALIQLFLIALALAASLIGLAQLARGASSADAKSTTKVEPHLTPAE